MSAPVDVTVYSDALVVLGTAGIVVPLVRRFGINPVLGYLGAGAVLGPLGLGSLTHLVPALYWLTVTDAHHVDGIAELGVVFLLFIIGLELTVERLMTMRRLVLGLGGLQVVLSSLAIGGVAALLGQDATASIVLGTGLSLSSTAIVLEMLSAQSRLATSAGRGSFAVLLAQDIAVIPILMFIAVSGASAHGSVLLTLGIALAQAAGAVAAIVLFGRFLMRPLFRLVAGTRSTDLFIAAVLFVIIAAGLTASQAGMSMALGAFVAGLLLAETEFGKAIHATVEPFKGLLLGIFFFTIGMAIDFRELLREPLLLALGVVGLIAGKALALSLLGRLFGLPRAAALEMGLLLGPGGEFAFVALALAGGAGLVDGATASFVLALVSITMALTPLLDIAGRRARPLLETNSAPGPELAPPPASDEPRAIVIGFGRVGRVVWDLLGRHEIPAIAVDQDAPSVSRAHAQGLGVYYGDAADPEFLKACGLAQATGVIITIDAPKIVDAIVGHVRAMRPDILIVARARDGEHARHLYAVGATDAVPETIEASLQLSEAALVGLGVPMGPAIASIHEKRDALRHALQEAAHDAGRGDSHAVRRQTLRRS